MSGDTPSETVPALDRVAYGMVAGAFRRAIRSAKDVVTVRDLVTSMSHRWAALGVLAARGDTPELVTSESLTQQERTDLTPQDVVFEREAIRAVREAHWDASRNVTRGRSDRRFSPPVASGQFRRCLRTAYAGAYLDGSMWVGRKHLLQAIVVGTARKSEAEYADFLRRIDLVESRTPAAREDLVERWRTVGHLRYVGLLVSPESSDQVQRRTRWLSWLMRRLADAGPVLVALEREAIVHAVRSDQPMVTPAHLLMAVLHFERELVTSGLCFVRSLRSANSLVLDSFHIDLGTAVAALECLPADGPKVGRQRRRDWRTDPRNPPWTVSAAQAADQARRDAVGGKSEPGTLHLLRAVLSGHDDVARHLLEDVGVSAATVLAAVDAQLARA